MIFEIILGGAGAILLAVFVLALLAQAGEGSRYVPPPYEPPKPRPDLRSDWQKRKDAEEEEEALRRKNGYSPPVF